MGTIVFIIMFSAVRSNWNFEQTFFFYCDYFIYALSHFGAK